MKENIKDILTKYNQEHIVKWMEEQEKDIKEKIAMQVLEIDFDELKKLYNKVQRGVIKKEFNVTPIHAIEKEKLNDNEKKKYIDIGEKVLRDNKYTIVTMAGGQGTRLRT